MLVAASTMSVPKPGALNADAVHPKGQFRRRVRGFRCAMADGITAGVCSDAWAKGLVRAFCRSGMPGACIDRTLGPVRRQWLLHAGATATDWFQDGLVRRGTGATMVGVTFRTAAPHEDDEKGRWSSFLVGDATVVQVRDGAMVRSLPYVRAAAFGNTPALICTDPARCCAKGALRIQSTWEDGDTFYLMTDALAFWFLSQAECAQQPWDVLDSLFREPVFVQKWIDRQRRGGAMPVDDVTAMRVHLRR